MDFDVRFSIMFLMLQYTADIYIVKQYNGKIDKDSV